MFSPLLIYRLVVLAAVSICVLFHACSSSSDASDVISSAALPASEPQTFPPDSAPSAQTPEETPADFVQFLPTSQDIQHPVSCGTYLSFDVPPSSSVISLLSLLDKVLLIPDANAAISPWIFDNVHDFSPMQIQNLIKISMAESFGNLFTETYESPNGFGPGQELAEKAADMVAMTQDYLNYLSEPANYKDVGDNPDGYPRLVWGIVKNLPYGYSIYDFNSNRIVINANWENMRSMAFVAAIIVHELTHWRDMFQLGSGISIAQTEANAYLNESIAYYFTQKRTKEIPIDWPIEGEVSDDFSDSAFIIKLLHSDSIATRVAAFFMDKRINDDYFKNLASDERTLVGRLIVSAFEEDTDVGDYVWKSSQINKLKWWANKHGGVVSAHTDKTTAPYKIMTGTSGSRSGWPIPSHGEPVVGNPQDVNAAMIEVFHIPNGFSIEVQGVKWPDYSASYSLGSQLFLKDEKSGKYVGNLWGVFDYLPEAGLYLLKGKMLDSDPNHPFDPNGKPPDPKKYILPTSPFDLKQPDCGDDEDGGRTPGERNPLKYGCFKSCQKEVEAVNRKTKSEIWAGCVEWGLPWECGASSRTFCWSHLGVPASVTCNASEPSCINTDYYREGPVTNLGEVPAYGTVDIDASSKKITLYFNASGGLSGHSTGEGEVYTLKSDGTWEGDLGGKIPFGNDGKSQEIPSTGIALWNPDPNDPNKFTIQYGPAITALLSEDHPLPGYTNPKNDPKCDMPAYGPGSFACERSADHPSPSCCWCTCGSCSENGETVECRWGKD